MNEMPSERQRSIVWMKFKWKIFSHSILEWKQLYAYLILLYHRMQNCAFAHSKINKLIEWRSNRSRLNKRSDISTFQREISIDRAKSLIKLKWSGHCTLPFVVVVVLLLVSLLFIANTLYRFKDNHSILKRSERRNKYTSMIYFVSINALN